MSPQQNVSVYLSHDTDDKEIAEAFAGMLRTVDPNLDIRMTSDRSPVAAPASGDRATRIYNRATSANYMVCLVTGRESSRPWIQFELGLRLGAEKSQTAPSGQRRGTYPLLLDDSTKSPGPLSLFAATIVDEGSLERIVREVTQSDDDAQVKGAIAQFLTRLSELKPRLLDKQYLLWKKLHDIDRVSRVMAQYSPSVRRPPQALAGDIDRQVSRKLSQCLEDLADIIGVDTLLNRLDSVEKKVEFHDDGTFEAMTTYENLIRTFPDKDEVTIHVPYRRRKGEALAPSGPSDEFHFEVKVGDGGYRPVPEFAFGDGQNFIRIGVDRDRAVTYRMRNASSKPFTLSRAETELRWKHQEAENPLTWRMHYSAFEVIRSCARLTLRVELPSHPDNLEYQFEENVYFVIWPRETRFEDVFFERRVDIREDLGLAAGNLWRTRVEHEAGKGPELVLEVDSLEIGLQYGLLWTPPQP